MFGAKEILKQRDSSCLIVTLQKKEHEIAFAPSIYELTFRMFGMKLPGSSNHDIGATFA